MNSDKIFSSLSSVSNITSILPKVTRTEVDSVLGTGELTVSDIHVTLKESRSAQDWEKTKQSISQIIAKSISTAEGNEQIAQHLNLTGDRLTELSDDLAEEVIKQIQVRYDSQGFLSWVFKGQVSEKFHYNHKKKLNINGIVEYMDINGEGEIKIDQKITPGSNMIHLDLNIYIRVISSDCLMNSNQIFSSLSRVSNIASILQKAKIPRAKLDSFLGTGELTVSDIRVTLKESKSAQDWENTKKTVSQIIATKISTTKGNEQIAQHLNITDKRLTELSDDLAEEVIKQIKVRYDGQGFLSWVFTSQVSERFHYNDTKKLNINGTVEYMDINGDGEIKIDQKITPGSNMIHLDLNIYIRVISINLAAIEYNNGLEDKSLSKELQWNE